MMKSIKKNLLAMPLIAAAMIVAQPAFAEDEVVIEGNVAFVSDYRFRGVSFSGEEFALQGGFDVGLPSGLYVGTWASSLGGSSDSNTELDLYAGYGFEAGSLSFDVGALGYFFPSQNDDFDYYEIYGSVGTAITEDLGLTFGAAYVPEQSNTGDEDNTYVYVAADYGFGDLGISASVGYEDGAFGDIDGDGDSKIDYLLGVSYPVLGVDVGASFIATSEDGDGVDETVVFSVSKAL